MFCIFCFWDQCKRWLNTGSGSTHSEKIMFMKQTLSLMEFTAHIKDKTSISLDKMFIYWLSLVEMNTTKKHQQWTGVDGQTGMYAGVRFPLKPQLPMKTFPELTFKI